jgi:allantoin racemase
MTNIALINPNTDQTVTRRMIAVAEGAAPSGWIIAGLTAERGARLITNEAELTEAGEAVEAQAPRMVAFDGAIVAAFGDPGLERLRARCSCPVVGIGESALREAAQCRRFAVATTTPALVSSIERAVVRLGIGGCFAGVALTRGDAIGVTNDPDRLFDELQAIISRLMATDDVDAVVIGGGPLADAARRLASALSIVIVEAVPAAVRHLTRRVQSLPRISA